MAVGSYVYLWGSTAFYRRYGTEHVSREKLFVLLGWTISDTDVRAAEDELSSDTCSVQWGKPRREEYDVDRNAWAGHQQNNRTTGGSACFDEVSEYQRECAKGFLYERSIDAESKVDGA